MKACNRLLIYAPGLLYNKIIIKGVEVMESIREPGNYIICSLIEDFGCSKQVALLLCYLWHLAREKVFLCIVADKVINETQKIKSLHDLLLLTL